MRTPRSSLPVLLALVVGVSAPFAAVAEEPAPPTGVWLDESGRGAIEITSCGAGLCGRLVWTKEQGKDARSACGMQIIGDVKKIDAGTWNGGWIYSPEMKARFDVELKPIDGDSLQVTGFAGSRDLSETFVWRRAPAGLGRCGDTPRAGYVAAKVEPKGNVATAAAAAAAAATGAGAAAIIKQRVSESPESAKSQAKGAAEKSAASRKPSKVAARGNDAGSRRHTSTCHVPFASFRCTSKTSRVLARIF